MCIVALLILFKPLEGVDDCTFNSENNIKVLLTISGPLWMDHYISWGGGREGVGRKGSAVFLVKKFFFKLINSNYFFYFSCGLQRHTF